MLFKVIANGEKRCRAGARMDDTLVAVCSVKVFHRSKDITTGMSANRCGVAVQLEHVRHQMQQTFRNITQLLITLPLLHTIIEYLIQEAEPPSNTLTDPKQYELLGRLPPTGCKQIRAKTPFL